MHILRKNSANHTSTLSLREILKKFIKENDISSSSIADEIKVHKETLEKFLIGKADIKFMQAIRLMKILGLTDEELISAYSKDFEEDEETAISDKLEQIAFVTKNFDIPSLKKIGIISPRAKMEDYAQHICSFLGLSSIYDYNDTSLIPTLYSKSRRKIIEEKESKMTGFWLKCAIQTFTKINNPNEYNPDLLKQLIKRSGEFTLDVVNGYYRFVLVLYQLGITVLTQQYTTGTKAYGGTLILNGKPCIIVTNMGKLYHKLWISLMHELYHVVNDFDIIETMQYHFSTPDRPDLLMNEEKANQFAYDVFVNPSIQHRLQTVVDFPFKVKALEKQLNVSEYIIYGVFLELLPNGAHKKAMFAKFNSHLISSDIATKNILFDPIKKRSLVEAIERMKERLTKAII